MVYDIFAMLVTPSDESDLSDYETYKPVQVTYRA